MFGEKNNQYSEKIFQEPDTATELPFRSEILSADQMELHARNLASAHKLCAERAADKLLTRLDDNESVLVDICTRLSQTVDRQLIPAEGWLLDNFYLIEEQIRTARRHFPKGYSRTLPRLANGSSTAVPRVYDIALEVISHGDGRVDLEVLSRFVTSYQTVSALKLGELWAIPIMLRLALIENLRRVATRVANDRMHRNTASAWADRMLEATEKDPKGLILVIADMARSHPPIVSSFVAELARRLQGHIPASALPLTWIEQLLAESHLTIEQLVMLEAQQQAADQVSISNSMGSLRFLGATDWREFVEEASVVEQVLVGDPVDIYKKMDFWTRDNYRHAIEKIARYSPLPESDVAHHAVLLAQAAALRGEKRAAHVGFYLVDQGLPLLEKAVTAKPSVTQVIARRCKKQALVIFLGVISIMTVLLTTGLLWKVQLDGWRGWPLIVIGMVLALCASRLVIVLVGWLSTVMTRPHALPRMDFSHGIPVATRTLIIVPTMLDSVSGVEELCEALEVRYLANNDDYLHFALLTDFLDAKTETCPGDTELLELAASKVAALNSKYNREDLFFLLHRPRVWNQQERIWMGYERKRGKLTDLNAFLRGGARSCFMRVVGDVTVLADVKYVITLDTDTQLPRDSARELIGAMAHPLNRAQFDDHWVDNTVHAAQSATATCGGKNRIIAGYAILQPRITSGITGANASRYANLCSTEAGVDPYTRVVADIYQNIFGEGSFIGKGIYDVDAFERALAGCLPENRILSHDLLEGCIARSGLLSDSQLYEDYPAQYGADVCRRQRWIRGDWQLAGWLLPRVPGSRQPNPLSGLSRWKILDNLLRSLTIPALFLLLLFGWAVSLSPVFWTIVALSVLLIPPLCVSIVALFCKSHDVLLPQHLSAVMRAACNSFAQALLIVVCLPFETYFSLDAILRTCVRMLITRRHLLEWCPSSEAGRKLRNDLVGTVRRMWIAPVVAASTALYLALMVPMSLLLAAPILLLWFISPAATWWISRPLLVPPARLNAKQIFFLRKTARRTWGFFENFVVAEDHWLPPDNYQEYRTAVTAHRTSPTNMGLSLLANLTAYDFGFIPAGIFIERTINALGTMENMERHEGHFYNWYDTLTLQPLHPVYISTVDSGNLAGHLLVLRQGLLMLVDQPVFSARWLDGLHDTVGILLELAGDENKELMQLQALLESICEKPAEYFTAVRQCLEHLLGCATEFVDKTVFVSGSDLEWWSHALLRQCHSLSEELRYVVPYVAPCCNRSTMPVECAELMRRIDSAFTGAMPTLRELARAEDILFPLFENMSLENKSLDSEWLKILRQRITEAGENAQQRMTLIEQLAAQTDQLAQMQYEFLYDKTRRLLAIGYNVTERRRDTSFYDLLASEARMASFIAIAQRQLPQENWFALGRLLASSGGEPVLQSWSGSMFEYLMPLLVMPNYPDTLLDHTNKKAVARQIEYGKLRGVPWGVSESGYNLVDAHLTYQYHAFGVPGLGLKRGLADDLVIAPYASALALMVAPEAACANLQRLAAQGMEGRFGFYEAVDYTPSRQRPGESSVIVHSFMAHHQGMSLLALAYLLLGQPMQRRFEADLLLQATLLLLQERIPKATAIHTRAADLDDMPIVSGPEMPVRVFDTPHTPNPEVQLLSNGRYHVMVTNAGGGYSRWKDLAVTRWQEDATCDHWGSFCYIRDLVTGEFWSTAHQPTVKIADNAQIIFSEGRAEFRRSDNDIETHTEIVVSPEDDIELRRIHLTNTRAIRRKIELTSYAETVIASADADAAHPAFSNLFVQTEIVEERQAVLCTRRPRSQGEYPPWMLHLMVAHGVKVQAVSYETDRREFIGRGNSTANPAAMHVTHLSGSSGSVLDPVVAIRYQLTLEPYQTATIDIVTGMIETREMALGLIEKYHDRHLGDRVFDLAWTHSQVLLRQLNATEADAQLYGRLAGSIIYSNATLRADASVLIKNCRGQSGLWAYSISGDLPIVLLQIQDANNIELVRQMIQAHAYWRLKGLSVDLVIWNEDRAGYRQLLQDQIIGLIGAGTEAHVMDRPGGIFVRQAEQIANEDRVLLQSVARVIISDSRGTLAEQINRRSLKKVRVLNLEPTRAYRPDTVDMTPLVKDLVFDNGAGGFSADGREYVITLPPGRMTPAPWANVLANPHFGTVISESGRSYTWNENAHGFRLTPWHNDAVCDGSGEAFYLRDEETGHFWSPTPLPCRGVNTYVCRHGFGYSVFAYSENGIASELTVFVDIEAPVKFFILKIRNDSDRKRKLSVTGYMEWVLGDLRAKSTRHVVTAIDQDTGALCARNRYSSDASAVVAFLDVDEKRHTFTGDRNEFLGRNGSQANPAALSRMWLSGNVGAALDPCAAIQIPFELAPGQEREIIFRLGVGNSSIATSQLIRQSRGATVAHAVLQSVILHWRHTLDAVQIETPDIALNMLTNGWLVYQVIACRLWARSGYYQSGGAFGFRDQLQDTMALIHTEPYRLREQLLLCASRQFIEGDVQHWWHPPSGRGVRTHCSDDFLWLPLATSRYVLGTGDTGVLNEEAQFLEGRPVKAGDDSYYDLPGRAYEFTSLYQHCVRAIRYGLQFGEHGLPLIGSGDWNDGMNLVGIDGKGESVWLGFFLCEVLNQFAKVATLFGDPEFAIFCTGQAAQLRSNIEAQGWDGEWYRRAYFDDGSPLGSVGNSECQIDSISQSWSVLSGGGGDRMRSRMAMDAVYKRLVRKKDSIIQLLDPPFDQSKMNPGYIKGYVPGVRENGGQYTHGAIWAAMAFAELGEGERAWELLRMINPVMHGLSAEAIAVYKVEPYVIAADVYAVSPHVGRGGWSWYTGSAGWMYRLIIESLLGLRLEVDVLHFAPCLPAEWQGFKMRYRFRETFYHIEVIQNPVAVSDAKSVGITIVLDGKAYSASMIDLVDDRQPHSVQVTIN